jgi:prepilin-type N-terminal cleavage/methylation domain-containing protein
VEREEMKKLTQATQRLRARLAAGEGGFTLPELLIAVVVGSTVIAALASAFLVTTKTTTAAKTRLDESHDTQQAAAFFTADAANASYFSKTTAPSSAIGTCDAFTGASEAKVGLFQWTDSGVVKAALYGTTGSPATMVRRYCENGVKITDSQITRNIGSTTPVVTCPTTVSLPSCSAESRYLELSVLESSGFDYTLRADPRTTGSSPIGAMNGIAIYVGPGGIAMGGGSTATIPTGATAVTAGTATCGGGGSGVLLSPPSAFYVEGGGNCGIQTGNAPADPLAFIAEPTTPPADSTTQTNSQPNPSPTPANSTLCGTPARATYRPGRYTTAGAHLKGTATTPACLASGTYYFNDGAWLENVVSAASGVHIYVNSGYLIIDNATLSAIATDDATTVGDQAGIAIFMGRSNAYTGGNNSVPGQVETNGSMTIGGVIYAPAGKLRLQGANALLTAGAINVREMLFQGSNSGVVISG